MFLILDIHAKVYLSLKENQQVHLANILHRQIAYTSAPAPALLGYLIIKIGIEILDIAKFGVARRAFLLP